MVRARLFWVLVLPPRTPPYVSVPLGLIVRTEAVPVLPPSTMLAVPVPAVTKLAIVWFTGVEPLPRTKRPLVGVALPRVTAVLLERLPPAPICNVPVATVVAPV